VCRKDAADNAEPAVPEPDVEVLVKLELMNPGGSLKDRPTRYTIEKGLADGSIPPGSHLLESSSGNFGIGLAITVRLHGLTLTCVVDPKTTPAKHCDRASTRCRYRYRS
jgi:cysteine synthase